MACVALYFNTVTEFQYSNRLSAECIWAASSNPIPVCSQSMKTAIANVLCPVLFSVTPNQTGIIPLESMGLTMDWSQFAPVKAMELYWYS